MKKYIVAGSDKQKTLQFINKLNLSQQKGKYIANHITICRTAYLTQDKKETIFIDAQNEDVSVWKLSRDVVGVIVLINQSQNLSPDLIKTIENYCSLISEQLENGENRAELILIKLEDESTSKQEWSQIEDQIKLECKQALKNNEQLQYQIDGLVINKLDTWNIFNPKDLNKYKKQIQNMRKTFATGQFASQVIEKSLSIETISAMQVSMDNLSVRSSVIKERVPEPKQERLPSKNQCCVCTLF